MKTQLSALAQPPGYTRDHELQGQQQIDLCELRLQPLGHVWSHLTAYSTFCVATYAVAALPLVFGSTDDPLTF